MGTIDIKKYIGCPAAVFELHGCANDFRNSNEGVACRIKVGPRRFLNARVYPQQLKLLLWQNVDGQVDYRPNEPTDVAIMEDGALFIDAVALARKYFGENISFCSKETWQSRKQNPASGTVMHTDCGLATSHLDWSIWGDIDGCNFDLYFAPGTLTLCGHDVQNISWSSVSNQCAADSEALLPLTEVLLDEPHAVTAEDFLQAVAQAEVIEEFGLKSLHIYTDRGDYHMDASRGGAVCVSLEGEPDEIEGYRLALRCRALQKVDIMLQMMRVSSADEIRAVLDSNHKLGLLSKVK